MSEVADFEHVAQPLVCGSRREFDSNDRAFFFWCANRRDLITDALRQHEDPRTQRALRLLELTETPGLDRLRQIGDAVEDLRRKWPDADFPSRPVKGAEVLEAVLVALREIVQ